MKKTSEGYRNYFAALRIFGNIKDFAAITKQLGIEPDHMHRKGERHSPSSPPYRHDSWQTTAIVSRNRSLEHHLQWLRQRLVKKDRILKQLVRKHDVDIYCSYHADYDQGKLNFPPEVLRWCGEAGIPIHVSILVQE